MIVCVSCGLVEYFNFNYLQFLICSLITWLNLYSVTEGSLTSEGRRQTRSITTSLNCKWIALVLLEEHWLVFWKLFTWYWVCLPGVTEHISRRNQETEHVLVSVSEWLNLTAFLGTADSEVHIVHISHVIIAYTHTRLPWLSLPASWRPYFDI